MNADVGSATLWKAFSMQIRQQLSSVDVERVILLPVMAANGPIIKRVGIVVRVRRRNIRPTAVIKNRSLRTRRIIFDELPIGIKI